jgi:hypothetical protein
MKAERAEEDGEGKDWEDKEEADILLSSSSSLAVFWLGGRKGGREGGKEGGRGVSPGFP